MKKASDRARLIEAARHLRKKMRKKVGTLKSLPIETYILRATGLNRWDLE